MTKEELKLHIENRYSVCSKRAQGLSYGSFYDGYMDCYSEFEETNNELKGKLMLSDMVLTDKTKRIKELEDKLMDKVCLESLDIVSAKIKDLEKENAELKRCEICKHRSNISGCSYQNTLAKDCKENGMKLFELKEIKEK